MLNLFVLLELYELTSLRRTFGKIPHGRLHGFHLTAAHEVFAGIFAFAPAAKESGTGQLFDHFLHVAELLEHLSYFLRAASAAFGNATSAAGVNNVRLLTFFNGHGLNNSFNQLELVFALSESFFVNLAAEAGNHANNLLQRTNFFHLAHLLQKVF